MPFPRRPNRYDWAHATWLCTCTIAGFVGLFFLPHDVALWVRLVLSLGIGSTGGYALTKMMRAIADERIWKQVRHLPAKLHIEGQDDGSIVCFFERVDGEPGVLTLPENYDPREDEGRHLFELLGVNVERLSE